MVRVIAWLEVNWVEVYVEVYNNLIDMMVWHDMFFWTGMDGMIWYGMLWYARSLARESNWIESIHRYWHVSLKISDEWKTRQERNFFNFSTCRARVQIRSDWNSLYFSPCFAMDQDFTHKNPLHFFTIHQSKHVNAFAILDDSDDESPKAAAAPPAKKDTKPKTQAVSNGNKEKR